MATVQAQVAHVWRRLGFGPRPGDVEAGAAAGVRPLIDDLLSRPPTTEAEWAWPAPTGQWEDYPRFLHRLLDVMATGVNPVQDRIYWFLSNVLVIAQTDSVQLNDHKEHVNLLRAWSGRSYRQMLAEMVRTTGMQEYLNGVWSTPPHPNENLGRELLELFSLGVTHPTTKAANYTETDIKEIARALTGFRFNWDTSAAYFDAAYWDAGTKTFLGAARGRAGVDEVVGALAGHASFRYYLPGRLYTELVGTKASATVLDELARVFGADGDVKALVAAIARRPEFVADGALRSRVKSPVELVLSALRVLGMRDLDRLYLDWMLSEMRQHPFMAPNVNGWPQGTEWFHAGHLIEWSRFINWWTFSDDLDPALPAAHQVPTVRRLHAEGTRTTGGDLALKLAGLAQVSTATRTAVRDYANAGTWNIYRASGTMMLVLVSPEFLVN